jgi:ferredoxin--NADP+ reductase
VTGVRVVRNRIEAGADGRLRAVPTGEEEVIACGLVLRSIGYRGVPLAGIPFDERRGLIRNAGGRVTDEDGAVQRGEYVVGWVKRGPSGVIGTNKKDAADTVARILEDREAGALNAPADADPESCAEWLAEQCPHLITWEGWRAIDEHETGLGAPQGRPRVKLVRTGEMFDVANSALQRR